MSDATLVVKNWAGDKRPRGTCTSASEWRGGGAARGESAATLEEPFTQSDPGRPKGEGMVQEAFLKIRVARRFALSAGETWV
jgi:hypothetical protein